MIRALLAAAALSAFAVGCASQSPTTDGATTTLTTVPDAPRLTRFGGLSREYDGLVVNASANAVRLGEIAKEAADAAVAERDRAMTASWRSLSARSYWAVGKDAETDTQANLGWTVCRDIIAAGNVTQDTSRDCGFLASIGPLARARAATNASPPLDGDPATSDLTLIQWQNLRTGVGQYERVVTEGWAQGADDLGSVPNSPAEVASFDLAAKKRLWCSFAAKTSSVPLWRSAAEDANAVVKAETVTSYYDSAVAVAAATSLPKPAACESGASLQCKRAMEAALNADCR